MASTKPALNTPSTSFDGDWHILNKEAVRLKASRHLSITPRPFLRWAGSKRVLLSQIVDILPERFRRYHEPFLGGGSLYFLLQPHSAVLSDICTELIETYTALRDDPSKIITYLRPLQPNKALYYHIRQNRSHDRFDRAAELIYLNKTCWNGLYRVNSKGIFNVPYGLPKSDHIADFSNISACAEALQYAGVQLSTGDFEPALKTVEPGDLVFLDPPYVTGHDNNGFIDYNEVLFSWSDQIRLAETARRLANLGASVLITNAYHAAVRELYPDFAFIPLYRHSTLASNKQKRTYIRELLLYRIDRRIPGDQSEATN